MRELQIVPVFPPREDLRIGDVFYFPADTAESVAAEQAEDTKPNLRAGFAQIPLLYARMDVGEDLARAYGQGPQFGESVAMKPDAIFTAEPTRDNSFTKGENNQPRIVGFPEFMSATYSGGDLSALVPTEAVAVGAAVGFREAKRAKLSVPAAEHYALGAADIMSKLTSHVAFNNESLARAFGGTPAALDGTVGYLRVVNEVFLARVMDLSLTSQASFGADADARLIVPTASGAAAAVTAAAADDTSEPAPEAPLTGDPYKDAQALNARLSNLRANQVPGGKLSFVTASSSSISMRRTFQRPVAIGYRGALLRVVRLSEQPARYGFTLAGSSGAGSASSSRFIGGDEKAPPGGATDMPPPPGGSPQPRPQPPTQPNPAPPGGTPEPKK